MKWSTFVLWNSHELKKCFPIEIIILMAYSIWPVKIKNNQMKILCIALSFYILALSYDTCNDFTSLSSQGVSVISVNHSHTHNNECTCSPFCHCNCCGKPIVPALVISVNPPFSFFTFGFPTYNAHPAKVALTQIWHPPVQLS